MWGMAERHLNLIWIVLGTALLLPILYVGSYLVLLDPFCVEQREPDGSVVVVYRIVRYRDHLHGGLAEGFYSPIHWVDRRLRPSYWGS